MAVADDARTMKEVGDGAISDDRGATAAAGDGAIDASNGATAVVGDGATIVFGDGVGAFAGVEQRATAADAAVYDSSGTGRSSGEDVSDECVVAGVT